MWFSCYPAHDRWMPDRADRPPLFPATSQRLSKRRGNCPLEHPTRRHALRPAGLGGLRLPARIDENALVRVDASVRLRPGDKCKSPADPVAKLTIHPLPCGSGAAGPEGRRLSHRVGPQGSPCATGSSCNSGHLIQYRSDVPIRRHEALWDPSKCHKAQWILCGSNR
jgi:hypothetical protein